jgi:uncharacterized spore protein YtfJ
MEEVVMEDVSNLVKTTMEEIEKMLSTKTVVGEKIILDGKTLIPLISVGFGFGAGGFSGKMNIRQPQEGSGGGTGGGGGIRPIAIIISDEKGIKVESIKGGLTSALEKVAEIAIPAMTKKGQSSQSQEESSVK